MDRTFNRHLQSDFFSGLDVIPQSLLTLPDFLPLGCLPSQAQAKVTREVFRGFLLVVRVVLVTLEDQQIPDVENVVAILACMGDEDRKRSGVPELLATGALVDDVVRSVVERARSEHPEELNDKEWEEIFCLLGLS